MSPPDECHVYYCDNYAEDDCCVCGEPTCRSLGTYVGERFVCDECVNNFEEE